MKKLLIALMLTSSPAFADFQPYLGAEVQARHLNLKDEEEMLLNKKVPAFNILGGIRFNDFVGLEAGAHYMSSNSKIGHKYRSHGAFLSTMAYLPIGHAEFFGGLGFSFLKNVFKSKESKLEMSDLVPRGIVGLQIKLSDEISLRGSLICDKTNSMKKGGFSHSTSLHYNAGVIYNF